MGWLFCAESKKNLVETLIADISKDRYIRHSVRGNNLWVLMWTADKSEKFILLCRMQGTRGNFHPDHCRWGYKDMTETDGPYYYDCPVSMVRESTCPDPRAVEWRKSVLEHHENKKRNAKLWKGVRAGDRVIAGNKVVVVTDPDYVRISIFTGRNRTPGQFLGYAQDDPTSQVFRYRKNRYTPTNKESSWVSNPL